MPKIYISKYKDTYKYYLENQPGCVEANVSTDILRGMDKTLEAYKWDQNFLKKLFEENRLYVVRLYDGFDNEWIDISEPSTYEEAEKLWNERTENGTKNTEFDDIDYYAIYPADTQMLLSVERKYKK